MIDRDLSVQFQDIAGHRKDFKSVRSLYDFSCSERDFWAEQQNRVNEAGKKTHQALGISNTSVPSTPSITRATLRCLINCVQKFVAYQESLTVQVKYN